MWFEKKICPFPRILSFDFTLYLKAKTWKFSFTSNFYRFGYIKHGKDFIEFKINRSDVLISHVK